ncbi:glycosyltransferase family 4 protein [Novosphingobium sp. ERN07]|uniref:glycosyltransferase n=1 Tax=Novosphingobium sp. ERN07 TaxID=2726187 RepID=UPI001456DBDF|nr:glycosyltransferase family 4 protein [Novosphingobium sp. ERN07]
MNLDELKPEGGRKPLILHVSADFPDPIEAAKTKVIRTLLDLTADRFRHRVISINRQSPPPAALLGSVVRGLGTPKLETQTQPFEWGEALIYRAPGRGLYHKAMLVQLGDRIAESIAAGEKPDLIVAHKLTVEGIAVMQAARTTGVPYAVTIQGDTDTKILSARPDLRSVCRQVHLGAVQTTTFAPWALDAVEAKLGTRTGPVSVVPCPTEIDMPRAPVTGGNGLLSVFHLKSHARKNLSAMAQALRLLAADGRTPHLAICGGGSDADMAAARAAAGDAPGLTLEGALDRTAVAARMNAATGFVLPSRRETFGLVFIEALFAGLPVIYPAGQAVSGYFDDCPFAIAVPPDDPRALADAMARLIDEEAALKAALQLWQQSPAAQRFTRAAIAQDYAAALDKALAPSPTLVAGAA